MQKHIIVNTATAPASKKIAGYCMGNGMTIAYQGTNDTIAHVSDDGRISWYIKHPGRKLIVKIEAMADDYKNEVSAKKMAPLLLTAKALLEGTFWFFKGEDCSPKEADTEAILTLAEALFKAGYLTATFLGQLNIISTVLPMTAYSDIDISLFIRTGGPQTKK